MIQKLIQSILTICLFFSSLYFPLTYADTVKTAVPAQGSEIKKSPETYFLKGDACLKKSDFACVKRMQASISSQSPYARLLEGALALHQKQTDRALNLLLPIQSAPTLIPQGRILLHQSLALAFESVEDTPQALQHWIMAAEAVSHLNEAGALELSRNLNEQLWALLAKPSMQELVTLRGTSSDNIFHGWIDLRLAAMSHDQVGSIRQWTNLYSDHPAGKFSEMLLSSKDTPDPQGPMLAASGSITLMIPTGLSASSPEMHAFHLGMQTALNRMQRSETIKVIDIKNSEEGLAGTDQPVVQGYTIAPILDSQNRASRFESFNDQEHLCLSLSLNDDAADIVNFADQHAMQRITVISSQNEVSQRMRQAIELAWDKKYPEAANRSGLANLVLHYALAKNSIELLELNATLMAKSSEMTILALSPDEFSVVKPYLGISMPAITFSGIFNLLHETNASVPIYGLRFLEMPFLLTPDTFHAEYKAESANLTNANQLRWFALGVDSILLTIEKRRYGTNPFSLSGLAGSYHVNTSGEIRRQMRSARLTPGGIETD